MTDRLYKAKILTPSGSYVIQEVLAAPVNLKGYSKFSFFEYKQGPDWVIREEKTGCSLATHTNQRTARAMAKEYLAEYSQGDQKVIAEHIEENILT